ncbi:hypothetical protein DJ84_11380 [Halorubrum ezzemoulense]|nr:hypothetical protein DJ84_11380 [Halorubrum ezzemoulense]
MPLHIVSRHSLTAVLFCVYEVKQQLFPIDIISRGWICRRFARCVGCLTFFSILLRFLLVIVRCVRLMASTLDVINKFVEHVVIAVFIRIRIQRPGFTRRGLCTAKRVALGGRTITSGFLAFVVRF